MARYEYIIDENNTVSIFDTENPNEGGAPNVRQSHNPTAPDVEWTREEATAWAEQTIADYELPAPEFIPDFVKKHRELMEKFDKEPLV
jgi:hypothetical protein